MLKQINYMCSIQQIDVTSLFTLKLSLPSSSTTGKKFGLVNSGIDDCEITPEVITQNMTFLPRISRFRTECIKPTKTGKLNDDYVVCFHDISLILVMLSS